MVRTSVALPIFSLRRKNALSHSKWCSDLSELILCPEANNKTHDNILSLLF